MTDKKEANTSINTNDLASGENINMEQYFDNRALQADTTATPLRKHEFVTAEASGAGRSLHL